MNIDNVIGAFVGLESSSNEYIAHLIAPYRPNFTIEIGTLLLIDNINNDIIARVMDYVPRGEFMSSIGEKWLNDIASQGAIDAIGQDIKTSKVSYKVRIKVLGSMHDEKYSPGLRQIPHITSKVRLPTEQESQNIIQSVLGEQSSSINIGNYALPPNISITFDPSELNSKRTFIFARAGYGKSNLMKILCNEWDQNNGGLLIFDQDGEYAVTDRKQRPGVMDSRDAILITNQNVSSNLKNVYSSLKINLGILPHQMIIPLLVDPSKHQLVFFAKLMAMSNERWPELVRLLHRDGWNADYDEVEKIVLNRSSIDDQQSGKPPAEIDIKPILNNLVSPIRRIHDEDSLLIDIVRQGLIAGCVIILDISRIDATAARFTSSIIVKNIFNENQDNFIKYGGNNLIKATFVLEEAHVVLSGSRDTPSAFVDLAKEGRKYNLGGIFITQQPGSIPDEIVSQGDNFFVFHLLSKVDLNALSKSNAHYSNDIITQILNEPIRGKSYMWTSHQPFVIPIMVKNFEEMVKPNQSDAVQSKSDILQSIMDGIHEEADNPTMISIRDKFKRVEHAMASEDKGKKTIQLFNDLTTEEKNYLMEKNYIQSGPGPTGQPFAVTYPFYYKLMKEHNL